MKPTRPLAHLCAAAALAMAVPTMAPAADYPDPVQHEYVLTDFEFHTGEVMPEMKVAYTTIGEPSGAPVMVLHGTTGSGSGMATGSFADGMFGPGQPLDATKYYIILPDSIGAGASAKPSDGMRASFPRYNYDDMVDAQYRLATEGLGLDHLRLIIGNSMGGMHVWTWATNYPDFADALVPMAALPGPMAGRNWMMRRMVIDSVRNDPAWMNGDYEEQPPNVRLASAWFGMGTSGGEQALYAEAPTNEAANAYVDDKLANQKVGDANDVMYQWDSSRDFDPTADLGKITAPILVINSADDERNPPELGILEKAMPQIANGQVYIIPASPETRGHGATGSQPELYAEALAKFIAETEPASATQ